MKRIQNRTSLLLTGLLWLGMVLTACKKENVYTYRVNDVRVDQEGAVKPNVKSDLEVISIAYTDLFGATIPPNQLEEMSLSYQAFGDKRLMIDMIILNFLNDNAVQIPTDAAMRTDIDLFVGQTYRKFFVREPSAFEKWYVSDLIQKDADVTPELVYYGFMTSNEYRHY